MISFDQVSKSYRTATGLRVILRDFDCDLPTDRSFGVLGRNGTGKSVFVRLVAGYKSPDSGKIYRDVRVSFPLAHTGALTTTMSGRENARFMARIYGEDPNRIVRFVASFSELGSYLDEPLGRYSNSMRARLAFGLCIAIPFDVYLIDEISAVGDEEFKRRCIAVLAERRKTANVLMVASGAKTMRQYCDSAAILENGGLTIFDTVDAAARAFNDRDSGELNETITDE